MEDYYVINNRLPRFPLGNYGDGTPALRGKLDGLVQRWLVERYPSNLVRRRACARLFAFARHLAQTRQVLEALDAESYSRWGGPTGSVQVDFGDLLACLRESLPQMDWTN